jgi:DNA repair exonuclease SbcCD nuclease subunit
MNIIHLSDTHVGLDDNTARLHRIIDDIISHTADPAQVCVVHTGDLIDSATDENRAAGKAALDRLRDHGIQVFVCPGNHDYGNSMGIKKPYAESFLAVFGEYVFREQPQVFPVLHTIGDDVVLIITDSNQAEFSVWTRLFAEGGLGRDQLHALDALLNTADMDGRTVILGMHHHPFSYAYRVTPDVGDRHLWHHMLTGMTRAFRRLKDAYTLCDVIRARVHIMLFGHQHHGLNCSSDSHMYDVPVALDGGSSTCTGVDAAYMRYRIIDTDTMRCTTRALPLQ